MAYKEKFTEISLRVPELVIPDTRLDLTKYAVNACDRYDAEYWDGVCEYIAKEPSALYFLMPDAWYKDGKADSEDHQTHEDLLAANMKFFLVNGSLDELDAGSIFVKRTLKNGKLRRGLLMAFDLEHLEFVKNTKDTCEEKLKRQVAIRSKAPLETPYIMLGYEDKENKLNSLLEDLSSNMKAYYDFDLMKEAGHLTGYYIKDEAILEKIADLLLELNKDANYTLIDGNDSLALAKANWDKFKKYIPAEQRLEHPARFTLVELVNLDDESLPLADDSEARFSFESRRITKINKEHIVPNASWNL